MNRRLWLAGNLLWGAAWAGCGAPEIENPVAAASVEASAQGKKFLLADEPYGAITFEEAHQLAAENAEIVLVGRIGDGGGESPWEEGRATFLLSDPATALEASEEEHAHDTPGHDAENCPFCRKNKVHRALTIVQFLGDDGKAVPIDARRLLGVQENQLVVVQGASQIDGMGNLVISASGLYIRR